MRIGRLFQFRNPLFWIFILLNGLSAAISYLLQSRELPLPVVLMLAGLALANMIYGLRIAVALMRVPEARGTHDAAAGPGKVG